MRKTHYLRRTIGVLVLLAAGISPFAVYIALKATEPAPKIAWPADVAVATAEAGQLRSLSLIHFTSPTDAMIVRFPIETSLNVPAAGTLRALTAYGIGGAPMLARAIGETVGVDAPYWALWSRGASAGRAPDSSNLDAHTSDVVALIADPTTPVTTAPGTIVTRSGVPYYELDRTKLALVLQGLPLPVATSPRPSPSPSPTTSPAGASATAVEVLNQGGSAGAATDVASKLQQAGYVDIKVGNSPRRDIDGTVVYYKTSRAQAEAVARVIGSAVTQIAELPSSIATTADVLVLVGRSPRTAGSTPRRSTPQSSPSPSESAVVVP